MRVGPYELLHRLGAGGAGEVFAARDLRLGRTVALKAMLPGAETDALRRFELEAEALAKVEHPHVVRVFSTFQEGGRQFVAMELLEGGSLQDQLDRGGPLAPADAVPLVATLARAMAHVHERGILHRDLKPANVLLGADGQPRLSDFGLAQAADRERLTRTGEVLGTPAFMAPEQASGERAQIGPATDVYALGATLFALLTGAPPFGGASLINVLHAVLKSPAPAPSSLRPDVDRTLDAICARCLEKDPGRRFPSAAALAEALEAWPEGARAARRPRRGVVLGVSALALLALGMGLAGWLVTREPGPGASGPSGATSPPDQVEARIAASDAPMDTSQPAPERVAPAPPARRWRWREVTAAVAPPPRFAVEGGLTWHTASQSFVLYGGFSKLEDGGNNVWSDTWAFDGSRWIPRNYEGRGPGKRYSHTGARDPASGDVLLFGGILMAGEQRIPLDSFWRWNSSGWSPVQVDGSRPPARAWAAMCTATARRSVLLFGGGGGRRDLADLWEWSLERGTWNAHRGQPRPRGRRSHAMAFDEVRGQLVVFGGSSFQRERQVTDQTWVWDGTRWKRRHPPVRPAPRQGAGMVSLGDRLILFGGQDEDKASLADTWAWDGERWEELTLEHAPPPRHRHGMGVDPERGQVVVFGGRSFQPAHGAEEARDRFLNDTWVLERVED